jgi:pSer/pThr/pTyr-binding forkhead associated (FHA) protein
MQARLHLVKGKPQDKQVEIAAGVTKVGRDPESDLIIAVASVSRHHCEIINQGNQLIIRDNGSGNGTIVNGQKVEQQALHPGDEIQIGPLTFAVEINGVRSPVAKPAAALAKPPAAKAHGAKAAAAKPKISAPPGKRKPDDVLASLERLAGGPKKQPAAPPAAQEGDDILEISDEDLLDNDK